MRGTFAIFVAVASLAGCDASITSISEQELSTEQCSYFAQDGFVTICHATPASRHAYAILRVPVAACDAHAGDSGDYIAVGDPTCNGEGCLTEGAPTDGTVDCCEGLVAEGGMCAQPPPPPPPPGFAFAQQDYASLLNTEDISIADVDGDGHQDVITSNWAGIAVMYGLGTGSLSSPQQYAAGAITHQALAVGDLTGDGLPDVVVTGQWSPTPIAVVINTGSRTFAQPVMYAAAGNLAFDVAVGDLDRDGKNDVVVSNFLDNSVSVLRGNGDGTLQAAAHYATSTNPFHLALGDVNADNKLDVVVGTYAWVASVLLGNGDGTLAPREDYPAPMTGGLALGDMDLDGDLDLAVSHCCGGTHVFVMRGYPQRVGSYLFGPPNTYLAGNNLRGVAIGELDGDGLPDLAVVSTNNDEPGLNVALLANTGDTTFGAPAVQYQAGRTAMNVAIGDLDGDGLLDFATANHQSETAAVSVFLNAR